jgi:hypothetical protein
MESKKKVIKLFSILAIIFVALMVCIFIIILSHSNIRETSPTFFMNMVIISFLFNTCAIVMELVVLRIKKKLLGSFTGSKEGFIFLLFTIITVILWFTHFFEFAGFIEKQGYEISAHSIWQIFAPLVLIGVFLMPFLCLAIIVLAASSFREHLRHYKIIEDRRILREIAAVLAGVSIMIGLTIVLPSVVGVGRLIAQLVRWCLPSFVGGMAAGYIARRKGWLFGLLIMIIPGVLSLLRVLLAYYWKIPETEAIYDYWVSNWWLLLLALVAGAGGGYIGELLFKTRHKFLKNSK